MCMTTASPRTSVLPYWNEIKKLSREDRSNLVELIESSLEEETTNQEIEDFLSELDGDLMRRAAEFAHKQYLEGKCTPHAEVMTRIKEKMGWR